MPLKQDTFTTLIRRCYDGSSYNLHDAKSEGREFEYVDVTICVEVREWVNDFPFFGRCVAAAPAANSQTGELIFREEDVVALSEADVRALRRECADHFARLDDECRRDVVSGYVYGADGVVENPFPDYEAAEASILQFTRLNRHKSAA